MRQIDYDSFPNQAMVPGLKLYFEQGILPGSFLQAVICNDLRGACSQADAINQQYLFRIVSWFYMEAPARSWGSPEHIFEWSKYVKAREST